MEKLFISQETTKSTHAASHCTYKGEGWEYGAALEEQLLIFDQVKSGNSKTLIICGVHAPVYTMGNSMRERKPESKSEVPFVKTDRGGQLMYHGPGQLTVYPIFRLKDFFSGPREYSKFLFDTAIKHFKDNYDFDVECRQNGLWFEDKKVGFLGLRIKDGITYHGLSLNYCTVLNSFKEHSPCDISGDQAGNLFHTDNKSTYSLKAEATELSKAIVHKLTK